MSALFLIAAVACFSRLEFQGPGEAGSPFDTAASDVTDDTGSSGVDDSAAAPVITAVEPDVGPTGGGIDVVISGQDLDAGAVQVWFGDEEATVTSTHQDSLTARLPAVSDGTGLVDVMVTTIGGQDRLDDGFQYWDDAGGQASMLVSWYYLQHGYAGYSDRENAKGVSAWVDLIEPAQVHPWQAYAGGMDSCARSMLSWDSLRGPESVTLSSSSGDLAIGWDDGAGDYYRFDYVEDSYVSGVDYSLTLDTSRLTPALTVADVFQTPSMLVVSSPNLRSVSPEDADVDPMQFRWTPGGGDYVLIRVVDSRSGHDVVCVAEDDGSFDIDVSEFEDFDFTWTVFGYYTDASVYIVEFSARSTPLIYNNSEVRAQAGFGVYNSLSLHMSWL